MLKGLLTQVRLNSAEQNNKIAVQFNGDLVSVTVKGAESPVCSIHVPTLKAVNYDTKQGKNMIIFSGGITNPYNVRIHGGDIRMVSWFGFKKNIHVTCAGFAREELYPK